MGSSRFVFGATYVPRVVDTQLDALLPEIAAIQLDGPKAVGKTETALQRVALVRRLDRASVAAVAAADPDAFIDFRDPMLLDEFHRVPGLWDAVKRRVDTGAPPGSYLLTGSAQQGPSHSGAGRILPIRMRPLSLPERGLCTPTVSLAELLDGSASIQGRCALRLADYAAEIARSGFPALQGLSDRAAQNQLDGYLSRIVDRDVEEAGLRVRRPATMMAWLRAYAAATATTTSWEKIRDAATPGSSQKPAKSTTIPYVDALTQLRILDEVPAWAPTRNQLHRLMQGGKHHLADPALAARLLRVNAAALLRGEGEVLSAEDGSLLGRLFESLVTMSVRVFAGASDASTSHLRVNSGRHEVDLIVERQSDGSLVAIEVKLSASVDETDVRHLHWLQGELGAQLADAVVLTTGEQAYRRRDGIAVVPLGLLGP